jgi:hypothetical protein
VLDGVYVRDESDGALKFFALPEPSIDDVARVAGWIRSKMLALIGETELDVDCDAQLDLLAEDEPLLAECTAAAVTGRVASGRRAGRGVVRIRDGLLARPWDEVPETNAPMSTASVCTRMQR